MRATNQGGVLRCDADLLTALKISLQLRTMADIYIIKVSLFQPGLLYALESVAKLHENATVKYYSGAISEIR